MLQFVEFDLLNAASLTDVVAGVVGACEGIRDSNARAEAARLATIKKM